MYSYRKKFVSVNTARPLEEGHVQRPIGNASTRHNWRGIVAQWLEHWQLCPVFDSRRRQFLSSSMSFQRSTDSNDTDCVLLTRCQEVFGLSLLPSCLSSDVALFQRPSCVYAYQFLPVTVLHTAINSAVSYNMYVSIRLS